MNVTAGPFDWGIAVDNIIDGFLGGSTGTGLLSAAVLSSPDALKAALVGGVISAGVALRRELKVYKAARMAALAGAKP